MAYNLFSNAANAPLTRPGGEAAGVGSVGSVGEVGKVGNAGNVVIDPNSATAGMDAVIRNMYTSPAQEEELRKRSVANQRLVALGDALRHIGNIYHTVNYAPSQQFNNPTEEARTRYERGKALRDAANVRYLSYQQSRAAQDARMKQIEAQTNYNNASLKLRQDEHARLLGAQKLAERKQDAYERIKDEELAIKKMLAEGKLTVDQYNSRSRRLSAEAAWLRAEKYQPGGGSGGVGAYTTETTENYEPISYDVLGNPNKWKKTTTKTRTPNGTGKSLGLGIGTSNQQTGNQLGIGL